mgnify:FL=1|jgi:hypothetical protein
MNIAFAIMFFLVGAFTNEVWRSILGVGFTIRICRDTVYQTFKVAKTFVDHINVILAYQYKAMKRAGISDDDIQGVSEINESALEMWKQAMFDAIMAEIPVLVKDYFVQKGWSNFDSIYQTEEEK